MAHLPQPYSAYHIFAQKYIERCKQVQKLANMHPTYSHQTFPAYEKPSSVIVLDDDNTVQVQSETNNTQSSIRLLDSTNNQPPMTNPQNYSSCPGETTDIHITGVSLLREWIDISELDIKKHLNPQAQNCDLQRREERRTSTETIPTEKRCRLETPRHVLPNKRKEDRRYDLSKRRYASENEESRSVNVAAEKPNTVEAPHPSNEWLNKRKEDDGRVLRSHDKRLSTTEMEKSPKKRRTRREVSFTFEDGEDSCYEPDEDWVEMGEEEESDEGEDVLTNVREKSVKRKKVKVRRKQRRKSVLQEKTNIPDSILREETKKYDEVNEQRLLKEQLDVLLDQQLSRVLEKPDRILTEEGKNKDNVEGKILEHESIRFQDEHNHPLTNTEQPEESIITEENQKDQEKIDTLENVFFHDVNDDRPTNTEQTKEHVLTEEKKKNEEKIDVYEDTFFDDENEHPPTNTEQQKENILTEETKDDDEEIDEEKIDVQEHTFSKDENDHPTNTEQLEDSSLSEENTEHSVSNEEKPLIRKTKVVDVVGSICSVDQGQAQPIPDKKKEERTRVLQLQTPGEASAKPEDPEVEILGDNWADLNVVEVISSEEEEEATQKQNEEKYKCDQCSYRTNWKSNLSKHIVSRHQTSSEIKWFECAHCPYRGKTREYLRSHLRQSHEQFITWYNCTKCHLKFKAKQFLEYHVLAVHTAPEDIEWFKCDECDFKCRVKIRLKEHKLNKHTSEDEIKWYRCKVCVYKGKSKKALARHEKNKHAEYDEMEWFKCEKCDYEGSDRLYLRRHVKANHPELIQKELDDISEKQLECKMCGVKMFSKSKFLEHFRWSKDCYF